MLGYVTLPSNTLGFQDNTNCTYTTQLERAITIESGIWEVGLIEVHHPTSWTNVTIGEMTIFNSSGSMDQ